MVVQTENINFSYSKSGKVIDNLNLEIPTGSIYGFLGPNGAGKTTTIRLLLGLIKGHSGNIKIFGKAFEKNREESLRKIGALIEQPSLYIHLTAYENLKLTANYLGNIQNKRIEEVLRLVDLLHVKNKKVKEFSLGMKQRLGLSISLLNNPEFLILDEPTNGLDPKGIIEMRNLIKFLNSNLGTTIFISSHLLSEIEKTCTHIGIINYGKMLFQDTVKTFKQINRDNIPIEIEVRNSKNIINKLNLNSKRRYKIQAGFITTSAYSREEIPLIIDELRSNEVEIYQLKIKDNLEDLFLSLTETSVL